MERGILVVLLAFSLISGCAKIGKKVDDLAVLVYESIDEGNTPRSEGSNIQTPLEKPIVYDRNNYDGAAAWIDSKKSGVNVRSGPSKQDDVVAVLSGGTEVSKTGLEKNGWVEVALEDGRVGWIFGEFLKENIQREPTKKMNRSDKKPGRPSDTSVVKKNISPKEVPVSPPANQESAPAVSTPKENQGLETRAAEEKAPLEDGALDLFQENDQNQGDGKKTEPDPVFDPSRERDAPNIPASQTNQTSRSYRI